MAKKLFVGGLPFGATDEDLKDHFAAIGEVESAKIITDRYTGQSKGFGFVEMTTEEDAKKAIAELNGSNLLERSITVNEARPQQPRHDRGRGGHGGGRGGFSGKGGFGGGRGSGSRRR